MDVLFIGMPLRCWDDEEEQRNRELDMAAIRALSLQGWRVHAVNADLAEAGTVPYGTDSRFIQFGCHIPDQDFLEDDVYWEDYSLLYISSAVAGYGSEYDDHVCRCAELAVQDGLFVCADMRGPASQAPWLGSSSILWSDTDNHVSLEGSCKIALNIQTDAVQLTTVRESFVFPGTGQPETFLARFLEKLLQGETLETAAAT
jgi:hypothetical protein